MADDNDTNQTPDDALEPEDSSFHTFNPKRDGEQLAEDNDPPAAPVERDAHNLPLDHPLTDSGIESDEHYQQGIGDASDIDKNQRLADERPQPLDPTDNS